MRRLLPALALLALAACRKAPVPKALFYYDLGPADVDVSGYPPKIQEDYAVFRTKCSTCHTTARPLNAPYIEAKDWEGYLFRMVWRGSFTRRMPLSDPEIKAISEFLAYDTQVRKVNGRDAFLKQQDELKKRFLER